MKIILKPEHFEKLYEIISDSLSAHQRAHWEKREVRDVVAKNIINKFKNYLGIS
tara:strand:+ start:247 stop:408 length:162 start_codon:yes stop_codon:yes gene_type:complete